MDTPNKIIKFFKNTFTSRNSDETNEIPANPIDNSPEWSDSKEMIGIKKSEYDSLQAELFNQTEVLKKLKRMNDESQSIINDYENIFEAMSRSNAKIELSTPNAIAELERTKSSEQRLKAHIQALKRDLLLCEERTENELNIKEQKIEQLTEEIEQMKSKLKGKNSKIEDLKYENNELKKELENKCCQLIELGAICREFLSKY